MNRLSKYRTELYGFSILWIMIFHGNAICNVVYFKKIPALHFLDRFISWGNMGVEIFILLAGISAYYSFCKEPDIWSFYKKRAKRIYLPILLICLPYWIWQLMTGAISLKKFLLDLTLLKFWITGDQQIWFVSTIIILYALYPYIHRLLRRDAFQINNKTDDGFDGVRKFSYLIEVLIVLLGLIFCVSKLFPSWYKLVEIGLNRLPIFVLGAWLGPLVKECKTEKISSLTLLFFILAFGFYLLWIREPRGFYRRELYELMGAPLTILLACGMEYVGKAVQAVLRFFGRMSLECYLAHIVVIRLNKAGFFFPYSEGGAKKYLVLLCIAVIVAFIAYAIQQLIKQLMQKNTIALKRNK